MEKEKKIVCHEGGSRSSKTWSIMQNWLLKALQGEVGDVTIGRDKLTWIKPTLVKDFKEMTNLYEIDVSPTINLNRSDQSYTVGDFEFNFVGLDNYQKSHGRKQKYFWLNEVMEIKKKDFDQIEMRTEIGGVLDYNPIDDTHWVFDLQKRDDVGLIKSTMLDNPFLPETIIRKILSYKPTEENLRQGPADSYMWEVYGLGNKAKLKGVIFENWDEVDVIPAGAKFLGYGMDFGYTNDPTAIIEIYFFDGEIYLNELVYSTGLLNSDIITRLKQFGVTKFQPIYPDSANPSNIEEIRRAGFTMKKVDKGQDSVSFGIDIMKSYRMHVTRKSVNLIKELNRYKWAEDKNGEPLKDRHGRSQPIDEFNHAIDAVRYCVMTVLKKKQLVQILPRSSFR
jgi:phage terminase large subunit